MYLSYTNRAHHEATWPKLLSEAKAVLGRAIDSGDHFMINTRHLIFNIYSDYCGPTIEKAMIQIILYMGSTKISLPAHFLRPINVRCVPVH